MITLLHEQRETTLPDARAQGDALWLGRDDIARATGWEWKPEGLCHADTCVPLPRDGSITRDGLLDLAAMWRHMGQPAVHDDSAQTWVLGTGAQQRSAMLETLEAPDFELPDLDGRPHRLTDYRGRKVFMATWASW